MLKKKVPKRMFKSPAKVVSPAATSASVPEKSPQRAFWVTPGRLVLLLLIVMFLSITLTVLAYIHWTVRDIIIREYDFRVSAGVLGIDADKEKFGFGTIPLYGHSERSFVIAAEKDARVIVMASGAGSEMISISENDFLLEAGENRSIMLRVDVNATPGSYAGFVRILLLHPDERMIAQRMESLDRTNP